MKDDSDKIRLDLTTDELFAIQGALAQICYGPYAIEDWEFHTLVGVTKKEAEELFEQIRTTVKEKGIGSEK